MRLLIIEDNIALSALLAQALRRSGFAVDMAHTGAAASELAAINDYDAVTLDRLGYIPPIPVKRHNCRYQRKVNSCQRF